MLVGMDYSASAFDLAYATLNDAQRKAVDTIEGPVMVIAGPGTGKTQILALRIAAILQRTDTQPESILAITFTEAGARNMRLRLRTFIGDAAYRIPIYTFHGFANMVIGQYPDAVPRIIGGRIATPLEKITLINDILSTGSYTVLRPAGRPDYYVQPLLSVIQSLKQERVSPSDLSVVIKQLATECDTLPRWHETGAHKGKERGDYIAAMKRLSKLTELAECYQAYEAALRAAHWYDFDDMIGEVVTMLDADTETRMMVQEQYQYVLADEHQDVNATQNAVLSLLTNFHERPNIFVVGDEKQAIFRFQGASLDNFLFFENNFGNITTISLTENYRSGQAILDIAHALVATDDPVLAPLRVPLRATSPVSADVRLTEYVHELVEDEALVKNVQAALDSGVTPDEIAVIVRTNREVMHFTKLLRVAQIPVAPSADVDILEHPIFVGLKQLIGAALSPDNTADLVAVLHAPYSGVSAGDLVRVLRAQSNAHALESIVRDQSLRTVAGIVDHAPFERIAAWLTRVREIMLVASPAMVLETLVTESGFLAQVTTTAPFESVAVLRRMYDEVTALEGRRQGVQTLQTVYEYLRQLEQYHIPLTAAAFSVPGSAVAVTTAHRAKGLEYEVVCIPRLIDAVWGKGNTRSLFDLSFLRHTKITDDVVQDDERRLLYVALTRAKHTLHLSYATASAAGGTLLPSRFLSHVPVPVQVDTTPVSTEAAHTSLLPAKQLQLDLDAMVGLLQERGVSATALNNFIKSPWQFIYQNLLRVPHPKSVSAEYGTVIHSVLRSLQDQCTARHIQPTPTFIATLLTQALNRTQLPLQELTRLHERGLAALVAYEPVRQSTAMPESRTEVSVSAEWETGVTAFPVLRLTGNLDRVDVRDGKIYRVVDFKTGKPKSRGEIMGTTKDSHGAYFRQLTFYAFLLSLQSDQQLHCRTGVLSFVEPNARGVIKEEQFEITDEAILQLENELRVLVTTIVEGLYATSICDPVECQYCDLVALRRPA